MYSFPRGAGCGGLRLSYAALGPHRAAIDVSPWVENALLVMRWADAAAMPRVEPGSVQSARPEPAGEGQEAASLRLRLGAGAAPGHPEPRVEFGTPDNAAARPLSLRCSEQQQLVGSVAQGTTDAEQEYRACVEIRKNSTNTRDLVPPQWCQDVPRSACVVHYYELPSTRTLVRCALVGGLCDVARVQLNCVPPYERHSPPPAPPRPPPAWIALARGDCAYLLRPPVVEALSSASFTVRPQSPATQEAAHRCPAAATVPTIEYRLGVPPSVAIPGHSEPPWTPLPARRTQDGSLVVDNVHCGIAPETRCVFRLRQAGWGESSRVTQAISGLPLPAAPPKAYRLELQFHVGQSVCMGCSGARAGLVADLAVALTVPPANVRIVEVREAAPTATVVFDLLPHAEQSAEALAKQLAAMLRRPGSDVYGGDISQFVDAEAGLVWLNNMPRDPLPRRITAGGALPSDHQLADGSPSFGESTASAASGGSGMGLLALASQLVLTLVLLTACLCAARHVLGKGLATRLFAPRHRHAPLSREEDAEDLGGMQNDLGGEPRDDGEDEDDLMFGGGDADDQAAADPAEALSRETLSYELGSAAQAYADTADSLMPGSPGAATTAPKLAGMASAFVATTLPSAPPLAQPPPSLPAAVNGRSPAPLLLDAEEPEDEVERL